MNWYAYRVTPIDLGWENLNTVKETIANLSVQEDVETDIDSEGIKLFLDSWENAKKLAKEKGWEGDFRHEPKVFWLPQNDEFEYGFVIKQDNNGDTFVISPQELHYLKN